MPTKIRALKRMLEKAGFTSRPGKGSHTVWTHRAAPGRPVTLSGADGDDAKPYQVKQVRQAIKDVEERG